MTVKVIPHDLLREIIWWEPPGCKERYPGGFPLTVEALEWLMGIEHLGMRNGLRFLESSKSPVPWSYLDAFHAKDRVLHSRLEAKTRPMCEKAQAEHVTRVQAFYNKYYSLHNRHQERYETLLAREIGRSDKKSKALHVRVKVLEDKYAVQRKALLWRLVKKWVTSL